MSNRKVKGLQESKKHMPTAKTITGGRIEAREIPGDDLFIPRPLHEALTKFKRQYVSSILKDVGGLQKQAARILHIQPTYLSRLIKELEIKRR